MDSIQMVEGFAALLALIFIYHIWPRKKGETQRRLPEPDGAWPVVGHLSLLTATKPLHRTLATLSDKLGPLFALRLGKQRALVVSNMDLAKECFTENDQAFAGRPLLESSKRLGYEGAMIGAAPFGPYWREVRKIATMELLSNRRLELLKHIWVEEVGSLVRGLYGSCSGDGRPVVMKWRMSGLSLNIILRMVVGKRYFDLEDERNNGEAEDFKKALDEFLYLFGVFTVSDTAPWLGWLDVGGHLKAMKRVQKTMDGVASVWLAEHRRKKESGSAGIERDFIDVLIDEFDDGHLSQKHSTDTLIKAIALNLIAGTLDSISATLEWTLSALLNNHHVLRKAHEELDSQVGRERVVDESDFKNLPYLQAIVKESMRLYPATPLLFLHESIEPVQVGGFDIPAGTILFINSWKIHRDPMLWPDPEEFKPERFLTSHKETNFSGQISFAFMPFGSGRRMCPGWPLAFQVLHLALARMLQSFEWSRPLDEPIDMTDRGGMTMPKASPLEVLLTPRLAPHLCL